MILCVFTYLLICFLLVVPANLEYGEKWSQSHTCTHAHTYTQPFYGSMVLSRTTRVSQYQKKNSPTHTCRGRQLSPICFLHLQRSIASLLFILRFHNLFPSFSLVYLSAWHSPLHTPYISSPNDCLFLQHMPYYRCSTEIMSSNPSLSLNSTWNSVL